MKNKKGQITLNKKIEAGAIIIIIVIVLFQLFASFMPEAQSAGDKLTDEGRCNDVGCFFNTTAPSGEISGCRINSSTQGNATACNIPLNEGIPLGNLFGGNGIVFLLLMIGLLLLILRTVLPKGKK